VCADVGEDESVIGQRAFEQYVLRDKNNVPQLFQVHMKYLE
jgi:hypothetical protein